MQVNKEKAAKVIDAMERDAAGSRSSKYSFDKFCRDHNLYSNVDKTRFDEIMICCPFHGDSNPSLSINEGKRIWNCLGCGRGGNYLKFVLEYDNVVLCKNFSFYDEVNEILKNDVELQANVGFSTIFTRDSDIEAFTPFSFERFRYKQTQPQNYLELASEMKKCNCTKDQIKYAILAMQSGLSVDSIYSSVCGNKSHDALSISKTEYDLSKMDDDYSIGDSEGYNAELFE